MAPVAFVDILMRFSILIIRKKLIQQEMKFCH
jgi:hypothetical protein